MISASVLDDERRPKLAWQAVRRGLPPGGVITDPLPAVLAPGDELDLDVHVVNDLRVAVADATVAVTCIVARRPPPVAIPRRRRRRLVRARRAPRAHRPRRARRPAARAGADRRATPTTARSRRPAAPAPGSPLGDARSRTPGAASGRPACGRRACRAGRRRARRPAARRTAGRIGRGTKLPPQFGHTPEQHVVDARAAERALVGADHRLGRLGRQWRRGVLAGRSQFQAHGRHRRRPRPVAQRRRPHGSRRRSLARVTDTSSDMR